MVDVLTFQHFSGQNNIAVKACCRLLKPQGTDSSGLLPDGLIDAEDEEGLFTHLANRIWAVEKEKLQAQIPGELPECWNIWNDSPRLQLQASWMASDSSQRSESEDR